jgi:hypothetical protein
MASSKYDDDYEEMLVEYELDVARQRVEIPGKSVRFRPEYARGFGGDNAALAAAALTN